MIRVAGSGRSGNLPPPATSSVPYSSSSTLSPLAPPFTVDRSLPSITNPSSQPPPPPACASSSKSAYLRTNPTISTVPYFVPTGDSVWAPSSSSATAASSRLGNVISVSNAVEAAPYYPYYAPIHDSTDGSLGKLPDYKGYVGGWNGRFDVEKGIPPGGSVVNSSWMDSSPCSQISLPSRRRGMAESLSAHEDSFGSWRGAHNGSSSVLGHVGSECSEWLDDRHLGVYVDSNRALTDGSRATELDSTLWPNEGSSYFYSPETTSIVKECDIFIPNSYDKYISQLISSSRDPIVHYTAPTCSRQGYTPSNERNGSLFSGTVSKSGNAVVRRVNLQKNDDYHVVGKLHDVSMYDNADGKKAFDKMDISGVVICKDSGTSCPPSLIKGLSSGKSSSLGQSIDCLQDLTSGFKVANLSCCKASNVEIGSFMPEDCNESSSDVLEHLNVAVDSPCWKGSSVSRGYPFGSDEILQPLVVGITCGYDDLVQGPRSSKIQSDIGTFTCNGSGKDIPSALPKDLSPIADLSNLGLKLKDSKGTDGSNSTMVENTEKTAQDIHGEYNVLIDQVCVPEGIDNHVRKLCQADYIINEGSSNIGGEPALAVQNSDHCAIHLSNSPNYPFRLKTSNEEMILPSSYAFISNEFKKPVLPNASSKYFSSGQDTRAIVKAMLSLSEVLLCHYCYENDSFEEDPKPVRKIIDNLEAVIRRNEKDVKGSCFHVPRAEEAQVEIKESDVEMSCNGLSSTMERNLMRSCLNNEKHDNITMKSFNINFEESDGIAKSFTKVLKSDFMEQEEDPKMFLYKKLWMQTEAALSSLKHDVALMKLEIGSFKHQFKGAAKFQTLSEGLAEPDSCRCNEHRGSNCVEEAEGNRNQNMPKEDGDASVIARYAILKGRLEADFARTDASEINVSSSYVDTVEKGVLPSHKAEKTIVANPRNISTEKFLGLDYRKGNGLFLDDSESAVVQEPHLSARDGSMNQFYNPKSHVKWLFSSGSESHSSEWEHVHKDEFLW